MRASIACGGNGVGRPPEGDEEGVALRVDLVAAVLLEGRAQQAAMPAVDPYRSACRYEHL